VVVRASRWQIRLHYSDLSEAPYADPDAERCGNWGLDTSGYPIMHEHSRKKKFDFYHFSSLNRVIYLIYE
jgi:hypothetical protein